MTYQDFISTITCSIEQQLPTGTTLHLRKIPFNNDVQRDGLSFSSGKCACSPLIYLDSYFNAFCCGKQTTDSIVTEILHRYETALPEKDFDETMLKDYERARDRVVCRLVHREKNRQALEHTPHIPYLDLAVTFACIVSVNDENDGSIRIEEDLSRVWGVGPDELFSAAMKNTPILLPSVFLSLEQMLGEAAKKTPEYSEPCIPEPEDLAFPMYVLTNTTRLYGAASLLYDNCLQNIAQKLDSDLCILPSSIHELILVPEEFAPERSHTRDIISECNSKYLHKEEFLSDHAYYYHRATNEVTC